MGQIFHPYEPDQPLLFPPSLRDWLPEGHLGHFVSDTVDELDLDPFLREYKEREDGRGQLAYHPAMMLKVLIFIHAIGVFPSRRIAAGIEEQVALRYLTAGNSPSHRTIAREAGLVKLGMRGVEALVALGRGECLPNQVRDGLPATRRMARRLKSERGRKRYRRRKAVVEPVFGWIKQVLGFRAFSLRSREKGRGGSRSRSASSCVTSRPPRIGEITLTHRTKGPASGPGHPWRRLLAQEPRSIFDIKVGRRAGSSVSAQLSRPRCT